MLRTIQKQLLIRFQAILHSCMHHRLLILKAGNGRLRVHDTYTVILAQSTPPKHV